METRMRPKKYKKKKWGKPHLEIGLQILMEHKAGQEMTREEIADFCGVHPRTIEHMEREALRKLRERGYDGYIAEWLG